MSTRRHLLVSAVGSTLAAASARLASAAPAASSFDFVFLTDPHVQPEKGAMAGVKQCFAKINALIPRPQFVMTGGDLIMDGLEVGRDRLRQQWQIWDECMKTLELPAHHTIGNHDVCGWSAKALVKPGDSDYGKKLFEQRYGEGRTYGSFDHGGWHFIRLDSIGQDKETGDYIGWLDDVQMDWLKADLEKTGPQKPIILITHIPFYSVWHQVLMGPGYALDRKALVGNVTEIRKLLGQYNVRLVLSGHGHILERIQFDSKVTYLQGGAVSGMWWKGPVHGNPEGFLRITCHPDGRFEDTYVSYGWKVQA